MLKRCPDLPQGSLLPLLHTCFLYHMHAHTRARTRARTYHARACITSATDTHCVFAIGQVTQSTKPAALLQILDKDSRRFIDGCLEYEQTQRPSATQLMVISNALFDDRISV